MRLAKHPLSRVVVAVLLVVGPVAGTALARGPKSHVFSTSTLELRMVDETDTVANWGDEVTFDVETDATDYPTVAVLCYQGAELVYHHAAGFYPEYPWPYAQIFTLMSNRWTSGAADCTATLKYNDGKRVIELATKDFAVAA